MDLAQQLGAVTLVLTLAVGVSWLIKRNRGVPTFRTQQLLAAERLQLTTQHSIHVVSFRNREILLIAHPHGCSVVEESKYGNE